MNSRERVMGALERTGYDRLPVKHEGTPEVNQMLKDYFGLKNTEQLLRVLGDDFRYVEPDYIGPELKEFPDGTMEGYWGERYGYAEYEDGRYLEAMYMPYAGIETLDQLDKSHFPSADWFDYSTIKAQCEALKDYAICFGTAGDMDFINSVARCRGTEQVLLDLATENEVYLEIMEARFRFYYQMHERALQAADGAIAITHIGDDLGSQRGPLMSMKTFERLFAPKYEQYFKMVHSHGARALMHMCGSVNAFLPRLIELGLDIYDVVQPTIPEQDIAALQKNYGDQLTFCGSMCVQTVMPFGSAQEVADEVRRRQALFPEGGLILGPTHAIQPRTPLENIMAMYRTAGSLTEKGNIDETILSIGGEEGPGRPSLSKLF